MKHVRQTLRAYPCPRCKGEIVEIDGRKVVRCKCDEAAKLVKKIVGKVKKMLKLQAKFSKIEDVQDAYSLPSELSFFILKVLLEMPFNRLVLLGCVLNKRDS